MAAVLALMAALGGVALLVVGGILLAASLGEENEGGGTVASAPASTAPTTTTSLAPENTAGTITVTDDSGLLSVSVPEAWTDVSGGDWLANGRRVGLSVFAATDRDAWYEGWAAPGVFIGVTTVPADEYSPDFDDFSSSCTFDTFENRAGPGYTAQIEHWTDCGAPGSEFYAVLLYPDSYTYAALIQLVAVDGGGAALLDDLLATLSYDG